MTNNKKTRILLLPGAFNSPSARFRIWQFEHPLRKAGFDVEIRVPVPDRTGRGKNANSLWLKNIPPRLKSILRLLSIKWKLRGARNFDYIITNRDIIPELRITSLEKNLIRKGCKLIFDFDDAIHLGAREKKLSQFLPECYYITPGNAYLADYAKTLNDHIQIIPTVVNTDYYEPAPVRTPGKLRIGWSGSSSTNVYCLPILKNVIEQLAKKQDFEFIVISNEDPRIQWEGVQSKFVLWESGTEVSKLQLFDIGLMPLEDNPFERGKCGLKAIQYMGVGIPALVSPVGVNKEIVTHGEDGFHCRTDEEWIHSLELLLNDNARRVEMGKKARAKVEQKYSVNAAMKLWQDILQ